MSRLAVAAGIIFSIACLWFQALMAQDIVRSSAEAVREARALAEELRELKEASWVERRKPL